MKKSVKQIIVILITMFSLLGLTACGLKTFKCDMCNKEKSGKIYRAQLMGDEITICEDCYEDMRAFIGN